MDSWRRTIAQLRDLVNGLAPAQRLTLIVVPLLSIALFGMILSQGGRSDEVPLSARGMSTAELKQAQEALRRARLTAFRVDSGRILVPAAEAARYRAALDTARTGDGSRNGSASVLGTESFLSTAFPDAAQRQELMDFARCERVATVIEKMQGIADAEVLWQRARPRYFGDGRTTAVLTVTLRAGFDLTEEFRSALQRIVGSALGMSEADVTVVDTRQGDALRPSNEPPPGSAMLADSGESIAGTPNALQSPPPSAGGPRRIEKKKTGALSPAPSVLGAGMTLLATAGAGWYARSRKRRRLNAVQPFVVAPTEVVPAPAEAAAEGPLSIAPVPESDPKALPSAAPGQELLADAEASDDGERKWPDAATSADVLPLSGARPSGSAPFDFLNEATPGRIASVLTEEHPQTSALVLSQLPASLAARVLEELPSATQVEVVRRVAVSKPAGPEVVREVAESLKGRMAASQGLESMTEGLSVVATLLSEADRRSNAALLEHLEREDSALVGRIRRMLFDFDDLLTLADDDIRLLHARTAHLSWALALKGASAQVKSKILGSLPALASEGLQEELHRLGPARLGDIALAQQQIADQAGLPHPSHGFSDSASAA